MRVVTEIFGIRAGPYLAAARMSLGAGHSPGLAFLAQHEARRRYAGRLVCSRVVGRLIEGPRCRPLAVPFHRPFQLGRIAAELLAAGGSAGAAMLRVQVDGRCLLFAEAARLDPAPLAEAVQWPEADVLFVDADLAAEPATPMRELVAAVDQAVAQVGHGGALAWIVQSPTVALDVLALVANRVPVVLAPAFAALADRCGPAGVALPPWRSSRGRVDRGFLVLTPPRIPASLQGIVAERETWLVAEPYAIRAEPALVDPRSAVRLAISRRVAFSRRAAGGAVDDLVRASGIGTVVAYGRGAVTLAERMQGAGPDLWVLADSPQLPLLWKNP